MRHVRQRDFHITALADGVRRGIAKMQSEMMFADVMREIDELRQRAADKPPPEIHTGIDLASKPDKTVYT
jgi:histidinol phosphatase-like PHP family hydrolase